MNGKTALGLDKNVGSLLCYLPVCAVNLIYSILVIVQDKENKDVRFHAFQSLLLLGACVVIGIGIGILGGIAGVMQSTILALLVFLVQLAFGLAILGALILCMVKAFQGQMFKLPIIGDMAEKWANS